MSKQYVGVFYVGVTTAAQGAGRAQRMIVTSVGSVATNSTIHRLAATRTAGVEVELGGPLHPTSLQDPDVGVQVFDAHFAGPEESAGELVKKAQALFADPDAFLASKEIDEAYRDSLVKFKKQVTHCMISVMRVRVG